MRVRALRGLVVLGFAVVAACGSGSNQGGGDGGAGQDATGGDGASGGDGGGLSRQTTVQNQNGVTCAGETVHPQVSSSDYPCDATMDAAAVRAVARDATWVKFLAGHWASSSLPEGGCALSTLCGQQYDPSLLYIRDQSYASLLTPTGAFNIPGINVKPDTTVGDLLLLGYNCLRNFPEGYMMGNPPIPAVDPLVPVDDIRTGEILAWVPKGGAYDVYRGRVEVTIDVADPAPSDLTGYSLTLGNGSALTTAAGVLSAMAGGTGSRVETAIKLAKGSDVAVSINLQVACLQKDKYITTTSGGGTLTVGTPVNGTTPAVAMEFDTYEFTPSTTGKYTLTLSVPQGDATVLYGATSTPGMCGVGTTCCSASNSSCNFLTGQTLQAGTKYWVFVGNYSGQATHYTLTVTGP